MTLRELRKSRGYTLQEVAVDLKMSLSSVCKYELGQMKLPERVVKLFCEYYNIQSFDEVSCRYFVLQKEIAELKEKLSKKENEVLFLKQENANLNAELKRIKNRIKYFTELVKENGNEIK